MREAALSGQARAYYELMSASERAEVRERITQLQRDPSPDGVTTFALPGIPGFFLYNDGEWRLAYAFPDEATLIIRSMSHVLDLHRD